MTLVLLIFIFCPIQPRALSPQSQNNKNGLTAASNNTVQEQAPMREPIVSTSPIPPPSPTLVKSCSKSSDDWNLAKNKEPNSPLNKPKTAKLSGVVVAYGANGLPISSKSGRIDF